MPQAEPSPDVVNEALAVARTARTRAHAPYSKFQVGAALRMAGRAESIGGCNVENASFGATVCAERTAFQSAVAQFGTLTPELLIVYSDVDDAVPPCALCLQVIAEFAADDLPIYLANAAGVQRKFRLRDLLPHPFRFEPAGPK